MSQREQQHHKQQQQEFKEKKKTQLKLQSYNVQAYIIWFAFIYATLQVHKTMHSCELLLFFFLSLSRAMRFCASHLRVGQEKNE